MPRRLGNCRGPTPATFCVMSPFLDCFLIRLRSPWSPWSVSAEVEGWSGTPGSAIMHALGTSLLSSELQFLHL